MRCREHSPFHLRTIAKTWHRLRRHRKPAHSARPPAASEKTRGVDCQPNADRGFIADDRTFEKVATAAGIFFRHSEQRRDDYSTDAGSRSTMNIIHLAAVCRYSHGLDGIQKETRDGVPNRVEVELELLSQLATARRQASSPGSRRDPASRQPRESRMCSFAASTAPGGTSSRRRSMLRRDSFSLRVSSAISF